MRRLFAILLLGSTGAASLVAAQYVTNMGPALIVPYLVMAIAAPIVSRVFELGHSYRQMFINCIAVGMIMAMTQYCWLAFVDPAPSLSLFGHLWRVVFLAGCVGFVSLIAAAFAWTPPAGAEPAYHRNLIRLAVGGAACAITYSGVGLWFAQDAARLVRVLIWSVFLGFYFVAVSGAVHLPILLGTRRLLRGRTSLALLGAILCPVPMLGFPFLQGRLAETWAFWLREPTMLAAAILPFAVAGAVLGWVLATRPSQAATITQ